MRLDDLIDSRRNMSLDGGSGEDATGSARSRGSTVTAASLNSTAGNSDSLAADNTLWTKGERCEASTLSLHTSLLSLRAWRDGPGLLDANLGTLCPRVLGLRLGREPSDGPPHEPAADTQPGHLEVMAVPKAGSTSVFEDLITHLTKVLGAAALAPYAPVTHGHLVPCSSQLDRTRVRVRCAHHAGAVPPADCAGRAVPAAAVGAVQPVPAVAAHGPSGAAIARSSGVLRVLFVRDPLRRFLVGVQEVLRYVIHVHM